MGQLVSADNRPFIVILSGEDIELKGESFDHPETIEILNGKENLLFEQYAIELPRREQASKGCFRQCCYLILLGLITSEIASLNQTCPESYRWKQGWL